MSVGAGIGIYFYGLPRLPQNRLLYNFINWIFQYIYKHFQLSQTIFLILLSLIMGLILFCILEIMWVYLDEKPQTSRGSARWATKKDIKELINSSGVPIGKFDGKILRINKTHLVTCAGTRSGKGIGAIIPTLLDYQNSIICLDLKGENFAVTAKRRKQFSDVYCLNPFALLDIPTNSYNWLDAIKITDADCIEKSEKLAALLVGRSPDNPTENHFNEQAIRLLQGIILFVCSDDDPTTRNICTVAKLIHNIPLDDLCNYMSKKESEAFGVISSIGNQFLNNDNEKEKGSILSTAQRATNFLDNPNIRNTLEKSDFDISQLPDKKMSIYLIMPQDKISDFSAYIRVFFDLAISSIVSRKERGKHEVLFLLDEVAQIGYLKSLADAVSFLRGLGGQLWFFYQSFPQLKNIYGKEANNILGNSTQIYYGCNDQETAELISRTLGKKTIKEYDQDSKKYHYISKDLLAPNEVRILKPDKPIIIMSGNHPIQVTRLNYLVDREFKGLFQRNPYFSGGNS